MPYCSSSHRLHDDDELSSSTPSSWLIRLGGTELGSDEQRRTEFRGLLPCCCCGRGPSFPPFLCALTHSLPPSLPPFPFPFPPFFFFFFVCCLYSSYFAIASEVVSFPDKHLGVPAASPGLPGCLERRRANNTRRREWERERERVRESERGKGSRSRRAVEASEVGVDRMANLGYIFGV
ncbi:uncharacterized protein [Physcomitrium patens]|uniref:uncharacterized protein n=1 Tax=Physcomitrium patens TaxID=3218 RepID=UPI003CCDCC61